MKGIIISHEDGGSYVLDKNGSFVFVRGFTDCTVGSEISIAARPKILYLKLAAAAACLVLMIALGRFAYVWNTVSFYAYVDINPSISLSFNRYDYAIQSSALNADGERLLAQVKPGGKAEELFSRLLDAAEEMGYDLKNDGGSRMIITLSPVSDKDLSAKTAQFQGLLDWLGVAENSEIDICTAEYREQAEEQGVSPGRLLLAEKLYAVNPSIPLEELVAMSVDDLTKSIADLEDALASDSSALPVAFTTPAAAGVVDGASEPVQPNNQASADKKPSEPDNKATTNSTTAATEKAPNATSKDTGGSQGSGNSSGSSQSSSQTQKPATPNTDGTDKNTTKPQNPSAPETNKPAPVTPDPKPGASDPDPVKPNPDPQDPGPVKPTPDPDPEDPGPVKPTPDPDPEDPGPVKPTPDPDPPPGGKTKEELKAEKEAQKAAEKAEKEAQKAAEKAAKEEQKAAEAAAREAEKTAKEEQKAAEAAARDAEKAAKEAEKAAGNTNENGG